MNAEGAVTISLNGSWSLRYGRQDQGAPTTPALLAASDWPTIRANVPGNVELDLLAAGVVQEPSVGNHVYDLLAYESYRWWYRRAFTSPAIQPGQRVVLRFGGLDCLGTVFLNNVQIGTTRNMLIPHECDITEQLSATGDNELFVRIDSAVLAGRQHRPAMGEWASSVNWESLSIRKAPHMYGWDIMPRIVSAGLWRDVTLLVVHPTSWREVYWTTQAVDAQKRTATVRVNWDFLTERLDISDLTINLSLRRAGRIVYESKHVVENTHGQLKFNIKDVDLWWPRGYGPAVLHEACITLTGPSGEVLAQHKTNLGIRTAQLRRTDLTTPEKPGEFLFVVNGEPIFAKGTNWVPLDAFHSRDSQHLDAAFAMLVDLNCNIVRCWGGNVYEDHAFFDLCDQNGVMVWQDFALACALYPQTDAFAEQMRLEAESVVREYRQHPSIVLWAGNNEIDEAYGWVGLGVDPNTDRISRQVLANVVLNMDPVRPYLPSSPYRSPAFVAAGNLEHLKPEDHLWGPRDDFKGKFYTTSPAHFASEIGYHGCPNVASLQQMMDPEHVWPWQDNEQWLTHAVRATPTHTPYNYRIPLMAKQIDVLFGAVPTALEDFILASQISQAEAFKFFIEHFRQGKFRRTGIIWWNLRDGWPIISDAIVDYYNRKKLAYGFVRRVQADVCPIVAEVCDGRHRVVVVNDTRVEAQGTLQMTDADTGRVLLERSCAVPENGKMDAGQVDVSGKSGMWLLRWSTPEGTTCNHYLAGPRPVSLSDYKRWLPLMTTTYRQS